jgi:hypothetical protein
MEAFSKWINNRQKLEFYGGSAGNPSGTDGPDGGDEKRNDMSAELPGAFPTYSQNDLPPTAKDRFHKHNKYVRHQKLTFAKKNCNCK